MNQLHGISDLANRNINSIFDKETFFDFPISDINSIFYNHIPNNNHFMNQQNTTNNRKRPDTYHDTKIYDV